MPERITASQARRLLGISKPTLARLIREGALTKTDSPLDKRVKLVRTSDVLALLPFQRQRPPGGGSGSLPSLPEQHPSLEDRPTSSAMGSEAHMRTSTDMTDTRDIRDTTE